MVAAIEYQPTSKSSMRNVNMLCTICSLIKTDVYTFTIRCKVASYYSLCIVHKQYSLLWAGQFQSITAL